MDVQTTRFEWLLSRSGPEAYERSIVPAWMGQWAEKLIAVAGIGPGDLVLDVACGTGIVARKAARRVGETGGVTGLDHNEAMVWAAKDFADREGLSDIDWRRGDASSLACETPTYDVALCQQGLQYFPDKPAALRGMREALVPQGRVAVACWRELERIPIFAVVADALKEVFGQKAIDLFEVSSSLSAREDLRGLLREAGFRDIRVRLEILVSRLPDPMRFLPEYLSVFPVAADIAAMSDADRTAMFRRMLGRLGDFFDDDGLVVPMESHIATAVR
ncbi:Methyltransferase type 11 [Solidesulfovibrio fructosivorans JJ]]|uniref:Methyltransferase type 11 n=1 Tax=Solidesulfovibrio fructosivorans JJ] TaxID=596151 RepID=E1K1Z7_SOLFR|nr:methyltransferase domain-containing protein [Solidesulfovibrio fructosivorans]EFL49355.1 Methyltransferase type 11 [Solidesulfovibrio fructosivorans JJ]]